VLELTWTYWRSVDPDSAGRTYLFRVAKNGLVDRWDGKPTGWTAVDGAGLHRQIANGDLNYAPVDPSKAAQITASASGTP